MTHKTLQVKLRPGSEGWLNAAAREVNAVWNFANETSAKAAKPFYGKRKWLTAFDMINLLAGTSAEMQFLPSHTIQSIAAEHANRRRDAKRPKLSWRRSAGVRKSLGWIPFRSGQCRLSPDGAIRFAGRRFRVFGSYDFDQYDFLSGSFSQNALGEWFFNVVVRTPESLPDSKPTLAVGVDLGLKAIATTSDGRTLAAGRWTQRYAKRLADAQRRGHKRQAKRINRKVADCRKDALHKFSTALVRDAGAIYIGDVSSVKLAKTSMAKSVQDSGWGMLKTMLQYKGDHAGRIVEIVNERFTTRACADCGSLCGPSGRTGLVVRGWTCVDCGVTQDRDINAARNILARGLSGPSAGTKQGEPPEEMRKRRGRRIADKPLVQESQVVEYVQRIAAERDMLRKSMKEVAADLADGERLT